MINFQIAAVFLFILIESQFSASQNVNLQQLSYGGEILPQNQPVPAPKRDFVNPNYPSRQQQPQNGDSSTNTNPYLSLFQPASSPANSNRRDFVNPTISGSSVPATSSQTPSVILQAGQIPATVSPNRRDYVNPNIGGQRQSSPTTTAASYPALPTSVVSSPASQDSRRDYINPNIGQQRPQSPPTAQTSPATVTPRPSANLPNNQRDYVNPNLSAENFPALPTRRGSISTTPATPTRPTVGFAVGSRTTRRPFTATTRTTNSLATDSEILSLTEDLFKKETLNLYRYITVNLQGRTRSSETDDVAPKPLLEVSDEALQSPTVSKLRLFYNNYELDTSVNEHVTAIERQEENDFLDAIMSTQLMRKAMQFLQEKSLVTPDPKSHRELVKTIFFTLYSRGNGRLGSSAFEHIFLSEIKNGTVTGLHNWVYFYEKERTGVIDYKGYMAKLDFGTKGSIIKFRFDFNGVKKPVNAMFVGTSPELELALYTICFLLRADKDCPVSLGGARFNMVTYTFRYRGKNLIGSAFPEI